MHIMYHDTIRKFNVMRWKAGRWSANHVRKI